MERYASLWTLIQTLEYGKRFHISIDFFNSALRTQSQIPFRHIIHGTPFCDAVKLRPKGLSRCMRCKQLAMDKAKKTHSGFGGRCVGGAYEYCHPVYKGEQLLCILFVGNIIQDKAYFLKKSKLLQDDPILETMEPEMPEAVCRQICAVLESYILLLAQVIPESTREKPVNATVAAVKNYIDCYFCYDISLAGLARLYHYNEKYLGSLFKKQLGISFHEYLNERRLRNAQTLLRQTQDSIVEVASRSGFNNVTYFNRIFKAKYHLTPTQFRLNCQKRP